MSAEYRLNWPESLWTVKELCWTLKLAIVLSCKKNGRIIQKPFGKSWAITTADVHPIKFFKISPSMHSTFVSFRVFVSFAHFWVTFAKIQPGIWIFSLSPHHTIVGRGNLVQFSSNSCSESWKWTLQFSISKIGFVSEPSGLVNHDCLFASSLCTKFDPTTDVWHAKLLN